MLLKCAPPCTCGVKPHNHSHLLTHTPAWQVLGEARLPTNQQRQKEQSEAGLSLVGHQAASGHTPLAGQVQGPQPRGPEGPGAQWGVTTHCLQQARLRKPEAPVGVRGANSLPAGGGLPCTTLWRDGSETVALCGNTVQSPLRPLGLPPAPHAHVHAHLQ